MVHPNTPSDEQLITLHDDLMQEIKTLTLQGISCVEQQKKLDAVRIQINKKWS